MARVRRSGTWKVIMRLSSSLIIFFVTGPPPRGETLHRHGTWEPSGGGKIRLKLQEGTDLFRPIDSTVEETGEEGPSDWAVAVPHLELEGELHATLPEAFKTPPDGNFCLGTTHPKVFQQYLVLRVVRGYLRDKETGAPLTECCLPWCTSTVAKGCAVS